MQTPRIHLPDTKEKQHAKALTQLLSSSIAAETFGAASGYAGRRIDIMTLKKRIPEAYYDEPRFNRVLAYMVNWGALRRDGFSYVTTEKFGEWVKELPKAIEST